jgi:glucose/mannose-6-phosphate isomerase
VATILDQGARYSKLDPSGVGDSVALLPEQLADGWEAAANVKIPAAWSRSRNFVIAGMGGSALGPDVVRAATATELPVSTTIVNGYDLPAWVDRETVVLAISYSGSTEETLSAAEQAYKRHARLIVMTTGGALETWARKRRVPLVILPTRSNPSGQPRLASGLVLAAELRLLTRLDWLKITPAAFTNLRKRATLATTAVGIDVLTTRNWAKRTALDLRGHFALVVAAGHLAGNAHILANQLNETAKMFAVPFAIPELNHHLLEGLTYPASVRTGTALFLTSRRYSERIATRVALTDKLFRRQHLSTLTMTVPPGTPLEEAVAAIALGSWLSYYGGIANGVKPASIPWVNTFKNALSH